MKFLFFIFAIAPAIAFSQSPLSFAPFEAGDSVSYSLNQNGKVKKLSYNFNKVTEEGAEGITDLGGVETPFINPGTGFEGTEISMSDGSLLVRKPAVKIFDTKMQLGSKWQNFYEVSSDNFKIQAISQVSVDKFEKVKLKFADIDCYVINANDIYQGISSKSEVFTGKGVMKTWVGVANSRLLIVKREYSNSFGAKVVQELTELPKLATTAQKADAPK